MDVGDGAHVRRSRRIPRRSWPSGARRLDTRRFRAGLDALLSLSALRAAYSPDLLAVSAANASAAVMRARMERCFGTHPNRTNPYVRALLVGELATEMPPPRASGIRLVEADAATFLEQSPPASFDGFTLSNILDGASAAYRQRLLARRDA